MGSGRATVHHQRREERSRAGPTGEPAGRDRDEAVWSLREGQREASLTLIGAIIPPWRGVPSVTSADRMYRSLDRFTGNSPCSRRVILGTPSQPTRPIRAGQRTPVRAPPSAQRFRSIRCARPTRPRPVRIRRKWPPEAPLLEEEGRSRWDHATLAPDFITARPFPGRLGWVGFR